MKELVFEYLPQRIATVWRDTIPDFVPISELPVTSETQRQFHAFLSQTANAITEHPDWLDLPLFPDDAYEHGELQNRRPELMAQMQKVKRKMDDFLFLLLQMGLSGRLSEDNHSLRIPKTSLRFVEKTRVRLARLGLTSTAEPTETVFSCPEYPGLFPAWIWLAADASRTAPVTGKKNTPPLRFSHALFSETYPYSRDLLLRICREEPVLASLVGWLEENGYQPFYNRDNRITADWVKSYSKKDDPLKDAWAERTHGGFSIEYEWMKKKPVLFSLRVPEYKKLLSRFEQMSPFLKGFILRQTKRCDGCGYCTQTDKTGTRKRIFIEVEHAGRHALCPIFPGFSFNWKDFDALLADAIKTFLLFTDGVLSQE